MCLRDFRPQPPQPQKQATDLVRVGILLSGQRTRKVLIRLCRCAGSSTPLLFAYDIKQVFAWLGSNVKVISVVKFATHRPACWSKNFWHLNVNSEYLNQELSDRGLHYMLNLSVQNSKLFCIFLNDIIINGHKYCDKSNERCTQSEWPVHLRGACTPAHSYQKISCMHVYYLSSEHTAKTLFRMVGYPSKCDLLLGALTVLA